MAEESGLSPEEKQQVEDFAKKIDLSNSTQILQYGAASQKKVADFSTSALENIRTKDLGEVGDMVTGLITELKGFDATAEPVSYTHLDVYKRQGYLRPKGPPTAAGPRRPA